MKVGIITITFNLDTRVFLLQVEGIKRFCKDDYTIEVIDNSSDQEKADAIKYHSKKQGVNYRKTVPHTLDPSRSHAFAANFAYEKLSDFYDCMFFMDHDLIPVKPFSVAEILDSYMMAGVMQGKEVKYLWPGCLFINNQQVEKGLVRFDPSVSPRVDTGGALYKLIQKYPDKILYLDEVGCDNPLQSESKYYYFYIMIHERTFLHFLNTSNWRKIDGNEERVNGLINIALEIMR